MYDIKELMLDIKNGMNEDKIYKKYGGFSMYIPLKNKEYKDKIYESFTGNNHHMLAERFNVSLNTIYNILKENSKHKQGRLF